MAPEDMRVAGAACPPATDGDAPIGREAILSLVPHQGAMCLWDEVRAWDARRIHVAAHNHRDPAHPLRSAGRLRALHLCEYGAQTMAVHGGLRARAAGGRAKPGLLVALRGIALHVARIDDLPGVLECHAEVLTDGDAGWQYAFRIVHGDALLAEGRAAVMLQATLPEGEGRAASPGS
jgi:predicted hotdog family 3-hydroxylacyl-ACP dehydratase